jgi:hypothetical protein
MEGKPSVAQPFSGQMTSLFFFSEALTDQELKLVSDLSVQRFSNFNPSPNSQNPSEAKIGAKLYFCYSPKGCQGTTCFDVSLGNRIRDKSNKQLPGVLKAVRVIKVSHIKNSIRLSGGIKV